MVTPRNIWRPLCARGVAAGQSMLVGLMGWLLVASQPASAAPAQTRRVTTIRSVQVIHDADATVVTIEADGPLPVPTGGQLDAPPRFFLDFRGTRSASTGGAGPPGAHVVRVRVATNTVSPLVTRVVLDLAGEIPITVESAAREAGRLVIRVGEETSPDEARAQTPAASPGLIPVPPLPAPSPPLRAPVAEPPGRAAEPGRPAVPPPATPPPGGAGAAGIPASPPPDLPRLYTAGPDRPKPPEREVEKYRSLVEGPLNRIRQLTPTLSAIDRQDAKPPEALPAARAELSAVIRALAGLDPVDAMKPTHDMLIRSASLALMAVTLRDDTGLRGDPETIRNASSAAAGSLLLIERVCIEIGCRPLPAVK